MDKLSREELIKDKKRMLEDIPSEREWNEGCWEMKLINTALSLYAENDKLKKAGECAKCGSDLSPDMFCSECYKKKGIDKEALISKIQASKIGDEFTEDKYEKAWNESKDDDIKLINSIATLDSELDKLKEGIDKLREKWEAELRALDHQFSLIGSKLELKRKIQDLAEIKQNVKAKEMPEMVKSGKSTKAHEADGITS